MGFLRQDVPLDHPDFGRLQICTCRQGQVSQDIHRRLFAMSNLDELANLTFETFKPRGHFALPPRLADNLESAFNSAQQYARSLTGWLMLQGGFGCGKTHLAAAIANFAVNLGVPTLFITVPDMLDSLRFAYGSPDATFEERFEQIRTSPLLVLDDFGTQNATAWAQEKLFQIVNHRYVNKLPLVITTNLSLGDIEDRIRSRLMDPQLVSRVIIQAPDYRNPGDDGSDSEISTLPFLSSRTFATFDSRREENLTREQQQSLDKAFQAARAFAERPQGWMVLIGEDGCGKTHLAAAIANYHKELGASPIMVSVPDLLDHLRATFSPNSSVTLDRLFESVRAANLLILDDLGTQSSTPWAREKLHQLFDHRYNTGAPTVITTTDLPENIDPRLRSRMLDRRLCTIYYLDVPPYTGGADQPKYPNRSRTTKSYSEKKR